MEEGTEKKSDSVVDSTQEQSQGAEEQRDRERFAILALVGLIGIAIFVGVAGIENDTTPPVAIQDTREITNPNTPIVERSDGTRNIGGRNIDILGLGIGESGAFFVHPETGMGLYTSDGSCDATCVDADWRAYTGVLNITDGELTSVDETDGLYHYAWSGDLLYLYNNDQPGQLLGEGGGWSIIRP